MRTVNRSAQRTAGKLRTQLVEPPVDILESVSTIGLCHLSIMPLACRWYADNTTLLIPYLRVNSATASLFSDPPSITSFPKHACRQMTSSHKKSATVLEDRVRKGFASTQPDRSEHATTKFRKPLQEGI